MAENKELLYLNELYTATSGETDAQVSMYDIGAALGLESNEAGELAQTLCIQGWAELKTLSGGIGITTEGLKELNVDIPRDADPLVATLGTGPCLDEEGKDAAVNMLNQIKTAIAASELPYPVLEEMIIDIKTIEIQMVSPRPKTSVLKEVFRSLADNAEAQSLTSTAEDIRALIVV